MSNKEINLKNISKELNFCLQINYNQKGIQSASLHPSEKGFQWAFSSNHEDLNSNLEAIVKEWLEAYCQKKITGIQLPFDWTSISGFTREVLQTIATIPFGSFSTYGQIAHLLNKPQAARAVGGACRRNPFLLFIPCHRVLDAKLELRGFSAGGTSVKKELLDFEGVAVGQAT